MASLKAIFDAHQANIRNRVMHGNLLEIEGKALDTRLPIAHPHRFPMPSVDPYMPDNVVALCLACLEDLDREVAARTRLSAADLARTKTLMLTQEEIEFGLHLHCEFLDDDRVAWLNYVTHYLNAMTPALKQPFAMGFVGWLRRPLRVSAFASLWLVFEASYRLTVHLVGLSIVQISRPRVGNQIVPAICGPRPRSMICTSGMTYRDA